MPKSDSITTVYRFGPFEVNTASGELLKHGVRVKLQEQPFRLLIVLLENAGEPVTMRISTAAFGRTTLLSSLTAV